MSKVYELVVYTASTANYANPLLDLIDPLRLAPYRLFKEHCTVLGNLVTKNLARLGRDLKDVIIVDNSPVAYILQPGNAIPVSTWTQDKDDRELNKLIPVLKCLAKAEDVREAIKEVVKDGKIDFENAVEVLERGFIRKDAPSRKHPIKLINNLEPRKSKATHALSSKYKLTKKYSEEAPKLKESNCLIAKGIPVKPMHGTKLKPAKVHDPMKALVTPKQYRNLSKKSENPKTFPYAAELNLKRVEPTNNLNFLTPRNFGIQRKISIDSVESSASHCCSDRPFHRAMTRANSVDIYKTSYGRVDVESIRTDFGKIENKLNYMKTYDLTRQNAQREVQNDYYVPSARLYPEAKNSRGIPKYAPDNVFQQSSATPRTYCVYPRQIILGNKSRAHK
eukprot:TRINITY_DN6641_c0_g1_i5.p1 TRINITY_DN6641_c0_g1~~TRINITY_DN6641_c0_g1_i5.p1  ORF type:complete len:393 (-),score=56.83 TRINITY_DN6641_c0_g1_i5:113-1291(-)